MIDLRVCTLASALMVATSSLPAAANAARFDGSWSMVAVTTKGHCGSVDIGLGINRGRLRATSGFFAFYPISISGRVGGSGHVRMTAVAGPRIARGTGRFNRYSASGYWNGKGPSGLCSGYWRAERY